MFGTFGGLCTFAENGRIVSVGRRFYDKLFKYGLKVFGGEIRGEGIGHPYLFDRLIFLRSQFFGHRFLAPKRG